MWCVPGLLLLAQTKTWSVLFWSRVLPLAIVAVCAAAVTGFALGAERNAVLFGFTWGTQRPALLQMAVGVSAVLLACHGLLR